MIARWEIVSKMYTILIKHNLHSAYELRHAKLSPKEAKELLLELIPIMATYQLGPRVHHTGMDMAIAWVAANRHLCDKP